MDVTANGDGTGTARNRSFTYDSLSQLRTATNPESGTITYAYDNDGNVITKTDARGIATTYLYDALNRVYQEDYSNGDSSRNWLYDVPDANKPANVSIANPIGRLVRETNNVNASAYFSYDPMGRIANQYTYLPSYYCPSGQGWCNVTNANYDLAGDMTSLTYPSGRKVTFKYDTAMRQNNVRFDSFNGTAVGYDYLNIPAGGFEVTGAAKTLDYGNGTVGAVGLNNRLQPVSSGLNLVQSGGTTVLDNHNISYIDANGHNNGNVISTTDAAWNSAHANDNGRSQYFTYDYLNRILTATEGPVGQPNVGRWGQDFTNGIDAWGNLHNIAVSKGTAFPLNVTIPANNQLSGYGYDASGDLTMDTGHTYVYDAEGQISSIDSNATTYTYDAQGQRVRKTTGTDFTEYIYFGGEPIAEKQADGNWSDYIFSGGKRIAKADTYEDRIHTSGVNCSNCGWQYTGYNFTAADSYQGYVIRSGDKLFLRQFESIGTEAGISVSFTDGTATSTNALDTDGQMGTADTIANRWHLREIDLSAYAGKAINLVQLITEGYTSAGPWSVYYNEIAIMSADGTVMPIWNHSASLNLAAWNSSGVSSVYAGRERSSYPPSAPDPIATTAYYHSDQLGSSRMMTSAGGWPVWQTTYMPYGAEVSLQATANHYKFTGKERDSETGNDYFGARYYNNSMGRFLSPDWAGGPTTVPYAEFSDPQSLNLYGYVKNNPTARIDRNGHCGEPVTFTICVAVGVAVIGYIAYEIHKFAKEEDQKQKEADERSRKAFENPSSAPIDDLTAIPDTNRQLIRDTGVLVINNMNPTTGPENPVSGVIDLAGDQLKGKVVDAAMNNNKKSAPSASSEKAASDTPPPAPPNPTPPPPPKTYVNVPQTNPSQPVEIVK